MRHGAWDPGPPGVAAAPPLSPPCDGTNQLTSYIYIYRLCLMRPSRGSHAMQVAWVSWQQHVCYFPCSPFPTAICLRRMCLALCCCSAFALSPPPPCLRPFSPSLGLVQLFVIFHHRRYQAITEAARSSYHGHPLCNAVPCCTVLRHAVPPCAVLCCQPTPALLYVGFSLHTPLLMLAVPPADGVLCCAVLLLLLHLCCPAVVVTTRWMRSRT